MFNYTLSVKNSNSPELTTFSSFTISPEVILHAKKNMSVCI